jgi:hypothetical protein
VLMTRSSKCETKDNLRAAFPCILRPVTRSGPGVLPILHHGPQLHQEVAGDAHPLLFAARASRLESARDSSTLAALFVRRSRIALGIRRRRRRSQRKNASALSSSVRRRAITDARSLMSDFR